MRWEGATWCGVEDRCDVGRPGEASVPSAVGAHLGRPVPAVAAVNQHRRLVILHLVRDLQRARQHQLPERDDAISVTTIMMIFFTAEYNLENCANSGQNPGLQCNDN